MAFSQCTSLKSIEIPDSVKIIADYAFEGCSSLVSVRLSKYVERLGSGLFYSCGSLESIVVDSENAHYTSIDGNLYTKDGKTLLQYAGGQDSIIFYVPETVTTIDNSAFRGCKNLMFVFIPESVTTIKSSAFFGCAKELKIYAGAIAQPSGWDKSWNPGKLTVIWGFAE